MALSDVHPLLYQASVHRQRLARRGADLLWRTRFAGERRAATLPNVVVRHQSLLHRRLGDSDPRLQETKVVNLRLAVAQIDGLVIHPGETFSFWRQVGPPTRERGFVEGLVLRRGEVGVAVGGGLCQLSNLLYWMVLHTPLTVVERHHHGFDPFPDDRRTLPFGSGATVFYNYGDLRVRNDTRADVQIRLWLTALHLHGIMAREDPWPITYHLFERGHRFVRSADGILRRENEIWRRSVDRATGVIVDEELVARNRAVVRYVPDAAVEVTTPRLAA